MALSENDLELIAQTLEGAGVDSDNPIGALRERFPTLRFVRLDAGDIEGDPIRSAARFDLYLLDTREHCPVLTDDLLNADAVVLTPHKRARG